MAASTPLARDKRTKGLVIVIMAMMMMIMKMMIVMTMMVMMIVMTMMMTAMLVNPNCRNLNLLFQNNL